MTAVATRPSSNLVIDLRATPPTIQLDDTVLPLNPTRPNWKTRAAVRLFDIFGATALLLLSLPIMVTVAICVRLTTPGPAIYRSSRLGADNNEFAALKFRSMRVDADTVLQKLLATDPVIQQEYLTSYKLKRDPRITTVGRFIRKTNLDEFPQLLNVLLGDMSLVGPRPLIRAEQAEYVEVLETIQRVKPGLTGLWQVSGRNDLSLDQRKLLEVKYATSRTLTGDIGICLKTAFQMMRPKTNGAY